MQAINFNCEITKYELKENYTVKSILNYKKIWDIYYRLSWYKLLGKMFTIKLDYAKLLKSYKENSYDKTRYYLEIERDRWK